jgi:pimeloyl-ACP methyl ester carboxylesterase
MHGRPASLNSGPAPCCWASRRRWPALASSGRCWSRWFKNGLFVFNDDQSRSLLWPGLGHWLHQEEPDKFNDAVLEWIAQLQH